MFPDPLRYPIHPLGMDLVLGELWGGRDERLRPINLCLGTSSFDPTPFVHEEWRAPDRSQLVYGPPFGDPSLRGELSSLLGRLYDVDVAPERIIITEGASGALALSLLSIVRPGDEIILPEVFYPGHPVLVRMLGGTCVFAAVDEDMNIVPESVEASVTRHTKAIVLTSPSNPFSSVLPRLAIDRIASLGVPVVSDEAYALLAPQGRLSASALTLGGETFVIGSFSKCYAAAGLRVGFAVVPEARWKLLLALRTSLNLCTALPSQACARALVREHDAIVDAHVSYLDGCREHFVEACRSLDLRLVTTPQRGFFGLVALEEEHGPPLEVAMRLVTEHRVAVAPGSDFSSGAPPFLRVNFAVEARDLLEGLSRLKVALRDRSSP